MRVCTERLTGKFIEMQSSPRDGTLTANAVGGGYLEEDVEERDVTLAEWDVIWAEVEKPGSEVADERGERLEALGVKLGLSHEEIQLLMTGK